MPGALPPPPPNATLYCRCVMLEVAKLILLMLPCKTLELE